MTPTLKQDQELKKYLRGVLKYRETYEEAYDHILTALEKETDETNFTKTINRVIAEEFGGPNGLVEMEESCYKTTAKEAIKQQFSNFKSNFKSIKLIYTLLLLAIIYYTFNLITLDVSTLLLLLSVVCFAPAAIMVNRYYYTGFYTKDTKKSIKDKIFYELASKPVTLIWLAFIFTMTGKREPGVNLLVAQYPIVTSLIFVLTILYVVSFHKLNQEEIKLYKAM